MGSKFCSVVVPRRRRVIGEGHHVPRQRELSFRAVTRHQRGEVLVSALFHVCNSATGPYKLVDFSVKAHGIPLLVSMHAGVRGFQRSRIACYPNSCRYLGRSQPFDWDLTSEGVSSIVLEVRPNLLATRDSSPWRTRSWSDEPLKG